MSADAGLFYAYVNLINSGLLRHLHTSGMRQPQEETFWTPSHGSAAPQSMQARSTEISFNDRELHTYHSGLFYSIMGGRSWSPEPIGW